MVTHPSILLIEDSPGECELFRLALAQTGLDVNLHTEQDAESAFRFLECQWMVPAVVPLRASNEGSPRPRVARAQETDQAALPVSLEFLPSPLEFLPIFQIVARISSFVVRKTLTIQLTVVAKYSR